MFSRTFFNREINLDQFDIFECIGRGGFGTVNLVKDKKTKETYALKSIITKDKDDKRLLREIEISLNVSHPTIIKCHGYSIEKTQNEKIFRILMDYSVKGSLYEVIESSQNGLIRDVIYSDTIRQNILSGIARGMKYLHDRNIVHRDLKPQNVLIDEDYHPHLTDFGLSKKIEKGQTNIQSVIGGTPLYMAPEIFITNEYDSRKADVYAFGIMIYEIITDSLNDIAFYNAIKSQNYKILNDKKIKKSLQDLIIRCTSSNPNERPTFNELFNKLSAAENDDYLLDDVADDNDFIFYIESITQINNDPYEELIKKNEELIKKNEELTKQNNDLIKSNKKLKSSNIELTSKNEDLLIKNENLSKEKNKLTQEQSEMQKQIVDLVELNDIYSKRFHNVQTEFLDNTVVFFNSSPLKLQHFIISEILYDDNCENEYLMKINDMTFFLSNIKELEAKNCIKIDMQNNAMKLKDIDKEYPIILLPDATNILYKYSEQVNGFLHCMNEFNHILFYINYPQILFDERFKVVNEHIKPAFNGNQIKIIVLITGFETDNHFKDNKYVKNVRIDSTVCRIGEYSFGNCKALKEILIPSSVLAIVHHAFEYCSLLQEITIPNSVMFIGESAFKGCSLKKVSIPSSVIQMEGSVFEDCAKLTEVSFSKSMKEIPSCTFSGCISLKKFEIPNSVKCINYNAFYDCISLTEVIVPSSLNLIYGGAFLNCYSLKQITIPSKTQINKKTFFFFSSEVFLSSTKLNYT